jgi:fructose-bisphosphate aldolase class II
MALVTGKSILQKAHLGRYAVGAFNVNNLEILQAIIAAAKKLAAPVIIQTSEGALKYAGPGALKAMVDEAADAAKVPVALHVDHGRDLAVIKDCIRRGWTSVMIDGSHLPFKENIKVTKKVVGWCHKKGIGAEAELGTIGGAEEAIVARQIILTEPDTAVEFVRKTGCDSLAVAIGTSHGAYKFAGSGRLDIPRLIALKQKLRMPLVLHGGSGVPDWLVKDAEKHGAQLGNPEGVPDTQVREAVRYGINKVNTDTDIRLAFTAAVRKVLTEQPKEFDPRKYLGPAKELMQQIAEHRMQLFGSAGKA